jgi:hypothetical protein
MECGELVASDPYPDEREIAWCAVCEGPLCEDDAIRLGGICAGCKREIEAP